jgi:dipeptidyl aminopeptidase/acylaminoacyl peptidase
MSPEDLYRLKLVGDAQLSPDGERIAYVVKYLDRDQNDYASDIYLWDGEGSRQYTSGGKDSAPRWSPDGRWLAFLSRRDGKSQIYLLPASGGEAVRLTDRKPGAGTPVWSPHSGAIAFVGSVPTVDESEDPDAPAPTRVVERAVYKEDGSGFIDDRRSHIFIVDRETKETRQITRGDVNDDEPGWSPDGRHLAFASNRNPEWDLESRSDLWIVPREGGEPRRVTDGHGTWTSPCFSPDGSRLALIGYAAPEGEDATYFPQLWTIARDGGAMENLLEGTDLAVGDSVSSDWSTAGANDLQWLEDGLYFLVSQRGTTQLYRRHDTLESLTPGRHHVMDFTAIPGCVAYTLAGATHPAEIARQPSGHAAAESDARTYVVTSHNADVLAATSPVQPEYVTFEGADGVEIDGWVMKPAGFAEGQRYPLVVYIHGGPVFAYGETFFHEFQTLASEGFGVFYCNPHGSSSRGQEFQVSIMGDWGNLDYRDMLTGVDLVTNFPWVDAHRLGVAGGSYGGFLTNWLISHTDRFAAACTERSICNAVSQGGTSDWAATRGERLLATPEGDPERLWAMSPLKYVRDVKTPTLIIHSERDDRCPIEQGEQWFMALKRLRVPVRFIRFPEESHGLSRGGKPSRRVERLGYITEWFKRWL